MSQLREQLRKIIPRLSLEANKLRDTEARSRWMKLKLITLSPKSLSKACAFYGWSMDAYQKWGTRLRKEPRVDKLLSKSRKPHRSPLKTKPRKEKKVAQIRRTDPSLGPERISDELQRHYKLDVPPSTVYSILKRLKFISSIQSKKLTKRHLKRYRRPLPGFLQMDFKYVPYRVNGQKLYQLSCVDHHSSWRLIRIYRAKNVKSVLHFLVELRKECPFPIIEIQTDNDTAFTDKFSSREGVTGMHPVDEWCKSFDISHRLIPVGVKELNGKVENTHKQDDREFYAKGPYRDYTQIESACRGYNQRWNLTRRTKALGFRSPLEMVERAYVRAIVYLRLAVGDKNPGVYQLDRKGNAIMQVIESPLPPSSKEIQTPKKKTSVEKYLQFLDWDSKKKNRAIALLPTMSQSFSI